MRRAIAIFLFSLLMGPLTGSLTNQQGADLSDWVAVDEQQIQWMKKSSSLQIPQQQSPIWIENSQPWWQVTALDQNRNSIHDSLETFVGITGIGLSYAEPVTQQNIDDINQLGLSVSDTIESVNAVLLGQIDASLATTLSQLDGVVMVERYGEVVFWGDVQTQAVKARNSSLYPGAWEFGVSGEGVVIAMVDTGVDNEHPGLNQKWVAGYDAVCFVHSDPLCVLDGGRTEDGSFDPDDGNQHGTACMGMASATGLDASGAQTEFYGAAPNASLVDVRIGTDLGAGPFENYVLEQEFYESAMNGIQWIIDHKDDQWAGADETKHGIDIISLSWGITSHEGGGSDGEDMHSRILNEAMEAGIVVSVAAGNDGPDNDGLSGMGSGSLAITVGATDDINSVDRSDDTVAGYSSRGPRRDNGDSNPLNELKPEISAPGTNIIQAEGCVTSGGCSNLLSDASQNGYTGRGSGTSYATPSVSGIIALMLEINPDLTPLEVKEIIKFTAERRGPATQPDVDPFWNRDFGWGMADAYEAVKLSQYIGQSGLTGALDVYTQVHLSNSSVNESTGLLELTGETWGQMGSVSSVEYRINDGSWNSVAFQVEDNATALQRIAWTIALDPAKIGKGNQTIEIRAINSEGLQSLPILTQVEGTGFTSSSSISWTVGQYAAFAGVIVLICLIGLMFQARTESPFSLDINYSDDGISEVLDADKDLAAVVDAELVDNKDASG